MYSDLSKTTRYAIMGNKQYNIFSASQEICAYLDKMFSDKTLNKNFHLYLFFSMFAKINISIILKTLRNFMNLSWTALIRWDSGIDEGVAAYVDLL